MDVARKTQAIMARLQHLQHEYEEAKEEFDFYQGQKCRAEAKERQRFQAWRDSVVEMKQ